ncbi:unnamed protein product [Caenorhabditis auriculariae]|uniref:SAM-dependent methyltransferase Erg6/SMT-type domain-containing protein n=1 Tax=Caenorhabditis auriculariae TaxID=2777116 RepID=A0A8S1H1E1_9PELO|nr:unnamed protein product [Caenorhabditis auriculariae]
MSIDMKSNFFKLILHFRRQDLEAFKKEHDDLYEKAKKSGKHLEVTSHYYSVMSSVIEQYFGGNFHFVPPQYEGQRLEDALKSLHRYVGEKLKLKEGVKCVDLGCGVGGVIRDIAHTGAELTGVTIAPNEADMGNEFFASEGLSETCRIVTADCQNTPFENNSQDCAFAIYSLKYIPELDNVMKEVHRILRPGGKFLIYDLIKTQDYDAKNEEHKNIVGHLEYACGMPSLHTRMQMQKAAEAIGFELEEYENLEETFGNKPFHYCFSSSPFFMWLVQSAIIQKAVQVGEFLGVLPKGFEQFNRIFLSGTVKSIVDGGQRGILSGAETLVFRKRQ